MDLMLSGKVAVVTGGSTGLSAAVTRLLAEEGCHVVVNYVVDGETAIGFAAEVEKSAQTRCLAAYGDISQAADVKNLIDQAVSEFGRLDIVVNSAAILTKYAFADLTEEEWSRSTAVNFTGAFFLAKYAVAYFLNNKRCGRIINIVSQSAFVGTKSGHVHYAAAKAGVVGMTVSLAKEVSRYGINVNAVAPGIIRTQMMKEKLETREEEYKEKIPIGRVAQPEKIAYVVLFLASKLGDYITGATIDASGGMLTRARGLA